MFQQQTAKFEKVAEVEEQDAKSCKKGVVWRDYWVSVFSGLLFSLLF